MDPNLLRVTQRVVDPDGADFLNTGDEIHKILQHFTEYQKLVTTGQVTLVHQISYMDETARRLSRLLCHLRALERSQDDYEGPSGDFGEWYGQGW